MIVGRGFPLTLHLRTAVPPMVVVADLSSSTNSGGPGAISPVGTKIALF